MGTMLYPVILSGGAGTRLWPLSRSAYPKQFLPLLTERTLFQETVLRVREFPDMAAPLVICSNDHRFIVAEQLQAIGREPLLEILEPVGRNTAPAAAVAAFAAMERQADALLLVLPADHLIRDVAAFHAALRSALELAQQGKLVTFGIAPTEPATGFGYIERGAPLQDGTPVFSIARFVEKPDAATARSFLDSGRFFWNSGMFVFKAARYLEELQKFRPAIFEAAKMAWQHSVHDLDFCRLDRGAFAACPSESIDYAVMENTQAAAVVGVDMGWSDIGSWSSLFEASARDAQGNSLRGDVYAAATANSYVRAESRMVAAIGVQDLVVVETADAVLVMGKEFAQEVRHAVQHLENAERTEHLVHRRVYRPWGYYEGIDAGERFQAKRIMVKPGARLSLQQHDHRSEHWVVISGRAKVTCADSIVLLEQNQSTYIPIGTKHRLENVGEAPLYLIEIQSGNYLEEDDIVRFDDDYRR